MSKQTEELKNIIQDMEVEQLREMLISSIDNGDCNLVYDDEVSVYDIRIRIEL